MKGKILFALIATVVGAIAVASVEFLKPNLSDSTAIASPEHLSGTGGTALQQAEKEHKFLFVLMYEKNDLATKTIKKNLQQTAPKLGARWVAIDKTSPAEQAFIQKFRINTAQPPYILTLAPNGAITGGSPEFSEDRLRQSMVSEGFQACLKPLQEGRLVILCLQNHSTKLNTEAMRGINEFMDDSRYTYFVEVIKVDPADSKEHSFLKQLKITPHAQEATTVFLAPPSTIIGSYHGAVTKEDLVDAIQRAASANRSRRTAPIR